MRTHQKNKNKKMSMLEEKKAKEMVELLNKYLKND